jgi:hypothetical protein
MNIPELLEIIKKTGCFSGNDAICYRKEKHEEVFF